MSPRMGQELALALALEGRIDAAEPQQVQLVGIAGRLAELPDPQIDASFAAALEARLLTEGLEEQAAPVARPRLVAVSSIPQTPADEVVRTAEIVQMPRRRFVIRRSIAAVAAAAMLAAFPVAAMANSLPGSPFYGARRAVENAQIALFGGAVEDGFSYMGLSARRVDEAAKLVALGSDAGLVAATLDEADAGMRKAESLILGNSDDAQTLSRFAGMAENVEDRIRSVRPSLSVGAEEAAADAIETSRRIREAVAEALGASAPTTTAPVIVEASDVTGPLTSAPAHETTGTAAPDTRRAAAETPESPSASKPGDEEPDGGDGNGSGKGLTGGGDGCTTIGGGNGLGDVLAPVSEITCG